MADTTTTIGSSAGDLIDESLVTQVSGAQAKRTRVVLGNDLGQLVDSAALLSAITLIQAELQKQTALARILLAALTGVTPDNDEINSLSRSED